MFLIILIVEIMCPFLIYYIYFRIFHLYLIPACFLANPVLGSFSILRHSVYCFSSFASQMMAKALFKESRVLIRAEHLPLRQNLYSSYLYSEDLGYKTHKNSFDPHYQLYIMKKLMNTVLSFIYYLSFKLAFKIF